MTDDMRAAEARLMDGISTHTHTDMSLLLDAVVAHTRTHACGAPRTHEDACAATRVCVRVFTAWTRAGLLRHGTARGRAQREGGDTQSRAIEDTRERVGAWAAAQFRAFLDAQLYILALPHTHDPTRGAGEQKRVNKGLLAAKIEALRAWTHFMAHAGTRAEMLRAREGGHFCVHTLSTLLRFVLAHAAPSEGTDAALAELLTRWGGAPMTPARRAKGVAKAREALSTALTAFRTEFVDEYDDMRYYTLRVLTELANAKAVQSTASVGATASADADTAGAGAAAAAAFAGVTPANFGRAAADLLLNISLPSSEAAWNAAEHASFVAEEQRDVLASAAEAATVGAHAHDDSEPEGAPSAPPAADDAPLSAAVLSRGNLRGAARKRPRLAMAQAAKETEATRKLDHVRAKLIDYGDDAYSDEEAAAPKTTFAPNKVGRATSTTPATAASDASADGTPRYSKLTNVRRAFAEAWTAVLRLPLSGDVIRRVLLALPTQILPRFPERTAVQLTDFLTDAYSRGGAVAVLALHSVFKLMQDHGLEYPKFYTSLYALLTPETLHAKYRQRFFTLLDRYLSSSALPAYLVAAFMKRMGRLALTAATPVAMFIVPFIYNCVKRHPACTVLLHRVDAHATAASTTWPASADPFDAEAAEPADTHALSSSLWELTALGHHFFAPVVHSTRVLYKEPTKEEMDVSIFAGATFARLITDELDRRIHKAGTDTLAPVAFGFHRPHAMFGWTAQVGDASPLESEPALAAEATSPPASSLTSVLRL